MEKNSSGRLLTEIEISEISKRKNLITLTIDFGDFLDSSKELSHHEYSDFLYQICEKYRGTVLEQFIFALAKIHSLKAEKFPSKKDIPELTYRISFCGGCGCSTGDPSPAGYAFDDACWCCD